MKNFTLFILLTFNLGFAQQPGDLVSSELKLDLSPTALLSWVDENNQDELYQWAYEFLDDMPYGMQAYKLTYKSLDYHDNMVNATGLVMFPKTNHKLSQILYMSPTTDNRDYVPSNLKGTSEFGIVLPMLLVASEYIVIAPDYLGMGDGDGELAYIEDKTAASAGLDMLAAANQFLNQLGKQRYNEYFVAGYSQGGHAAMAVNKFNQELRHPYNIAYVASGAGPYDMSDSMLNHGILNKEEYPNSAFIAYVIQTCHNIGYTQFNSSWNEVISDEYIDQFRASALNGEGGLNWGPEVWRDLFQDDFISNLEQNPNHPARLCAASNNVHDFYNKTPTMMFSSWFDETVISRNDEVALDAQRAYYPWWNLGKYKIQKRSLGPWNHGIGSFPYIFAAMFKFNQNRTGGFFNTFAANTGEYSSIYDRSTQDDLALSFVPSSIAPEINGHQSLSHKNLQDNTQRPITELSRIEENISLVKVTMADGTQRSFPFMQEEAIALEAKDVLSIQHSQLTVNMKNWPSDIKAINFIQNATIVSLFNNKNNTKTFEFDLASLPAFEMIEIVADAAIFTVKMPENVDVKSSSIQVVQVSNTAQLKAIKMMEKVEVYNLNGNLIAQINGDNQTDLTFNLNKGMYIINTTYTDGSTESTKHIQK